MMAFLMLIWGPQGYWALVGNAHQLWISQLFIQELWVHFRCICRPDAAVGTQCVQWEMRPQRQMPHSLGCQKFSRGKGVQLIVSWGTKMNLAQNEEWGRALVPKCSFKWPVVCGGYKWRGWVGMARLLTWPTKIYAQKQRLALTRVQSAGPREKEITGPGLGPLIFISASWCGRAHSWQDLQFPAAYSSARWHTQLPPKSQSTDFSESPWECTFTRGAWCGNIQASGNKIKYFLYPHKNKSADGATIICKRANLSKQWKYLNVFSQLTYYVPTVW